MSVKPPKPLLPDPLRINLGSGPQKYSGYLSVDTVPEWADVVHDLNDPLPFPDSSVSEIFASHVIEHFPFHSIQRLLQDWCRVLKPRTGLFWGFVPDGKRVAERYLEAVEANDRHTKLVMMTNFCGGFTNNRYIGPGQIHYAVYDQNSLSEILYQGGFYPVFIEAQEAGHLDYRLAFACGKGVYEPADIGGVGRPTVPWRP